jgi:cell division inhibitor SepF
MDEMEVQDKPGFFGRLRDLFVREEEYEDTPSSVAVATAERPMPSRPRMEVRDMYKYHVQIRRQIMSFDDALAAAQGLKNGEQQVLNLSMTEPTLREKIKDFMCGVNFSQEGTWEEIGDHIYLVVPSNVFVEVAPPSARQIAGRN